MQKYANLVHQDIQPQAGNNLSWATLGAVQVALLHQTAIEAKAVTSQLAAYHFLPAPGGYVNMRGGPLVIGGMSEPQP